jgi:hypothetical protein
MSYLPPSSTDAEATNVMPRQQGYAVMRWFLLRINDSIVPFKYVVEYDLISIW